ncbi:MAG: nuclear transport factor 2 family protein [Hydrogenophilaceae bacterium]|nr:nuclear transport factor 2 family protein [Hydrogenophilaceae bacterium]
MSVESIVRELKDRADILDLKSAYCRYADELNAAGMLSTLTEDCEVTYVPGEGGPMRRAALTEMLAAYFAEVTSSWHMIANPEFHFETPDRVALKAYMYSWTRFKGHPAAADAHRWGRYEDLFVRTPNGWRIAQLRLLSAGEYGGDRIAEQFGRPFPPRFE